MICIWLFSREIVGKDIMAGNGPPLTTDPTPEEGDPCRRTFRSPLAGVRISATGGLQVGSTLKLVAIDVGQVQALACVRFDDDQVVGTVSSKRAFTLLKCIRNGHKYLGDIVAFDYGFIEISVRLDR